MIHNCISRGANFLKKERFLVLEFFSKFLRMHCILGDFLFPFSGDTERVHWKRMGQNKDEHRYDVDYAVKVIFNFFMTEVSII